MNPAIVRLRFVEGVSNISKASSSLRLIIVPDATLCLTEIVATLDNEGVDVLLE